MSGWVRGKDKQAVRMSLLLLLLNHPPTHPPTHPPNHPPTHPPTHPQEESLAVVHLADAAGLTISILVGIFLVACRRVSANRYPTHPPTHPPTHLYN